MKNKEDASKKLDEAVNQYKHASTPPPTIKNGANIIKEFVEEVVKDELKILTASVREDITKLQEAVKMYVKVSNNVEKRQTALETKIETSVNILKFLFGGGVILTLVNIIVMILIAVFK